MLDKDPKVAATYMVDSHVNKMILESAQLLSTAHRVLDGEQFIILKKKKVWRIDDERNEILYQATHINHPCAKWIRESVENYQWLVDHYFALCSEFEYRREKKHATSQRINWHVTSPPHKLRDWDWTPPPCAMPDQYKISQDYVENYREYYRKGKVHLHEWTKREPPSWL